MKDIVNRLRNNSFVADPDMTDDAADELEALYKQLGECSGGYQTLEKEVEALRKRGKFTLGDMVLKTAGSEWQGRVVGTYSTTLTPEGYCIESDAHPGSVQIYPAAALRRFQPERNIL